MKNIAILVDGKIKFVAKWPEQIKYCERFALNYCEHGNDDLHCICGMHFFGIQQALANAIEFKDQEEIKLTLWIKFKMFKDKHFHSTFGILYPKERAEFEDWSMEPLKPYEIPSELKIVIKAVLPPNTGITAPLTERVKDYAFIERQPKGKKCEDACDWPNCTLDGCKDKKEETSDDLFELLREFVGGDDSERWQLARNHFTVGRVKK